MTNEKYGGCVSATILGLKLASLTTTCAAGNVEEIAKPFNPGLGVRKLGVMRLSSDDRKIFNSGCRP